MKKNNRVSIFIILGLLFICPGIFAYLFYSHPTWLGSRSTNRGTLLNPPILFAETKPDKHWDILVKQEKNCATECVNTLDKLARIRLALGRHLYDVDVVLALPDKTLLPARTIKMFKDNDIKVSRIQNLDKVANWSDDTAFIVNPDGYIVLSYESPISAEAIFHDLKHLLANGESQ